MIKTATLALCLSLITSAAAAADFPRGDANLSGQVNLSDAISTLSYLFSGGTAPYGTVPCQ